MVMVKFSLSTPWCCLLLCISKYQSHGALPYDVSLYYSFIVVVCDYKLDLVRLQVIVTVDGCNGDSALSTLQQTLACCRRHLNTSISQLSSEEATSYTAQRTVASFSRASRCVSVAVPVVIVIVVCLLDS